MLAAAPSSADSPVQEDGKEVQLPNTSGGIELPRYRGYRISLATASDHLVRLSVVRLLQPELGAYARAYYAVRPTTPLSSGVLRADFGGIGSVTLRFHPKNREVGENRKRCKGHRPVTERGTYHGTVELRGEGGYFEVATRTAPGTRRRSFTLRCDPGRAQQPAAGSLESYVEPNLRAGYGGDELLSLLWAESDIAGRHVALRAADYEGGIHFDEVGAGVLESQPEMAIGRWANLLSPIGPLEIVPEASALTASISQLGPFFGMGSYVERPAAAPSWTGTYGASLPGLLQPLTGPEFTADLCVRGPATAQSCARADLGHSFTS